jgi:membrane protease YdiL (CAAX protease family)
MTTPQELGLTLGSHVALDHVLLVVIAIVSPLFDWLWLYPRFLRAAKAGVPDARRRLYLMGILSSWGLTVCVLALWTADRRPWAGLGLGVSTPLRTGIGVALVAAYLFLIWKARRTLLARPDRLERFRRRLGDGDPLMPRTPGERQGFTVVAITAGICEELLYRGFVLWYLSVWTGPVLAVVISSALFGFAHLYLGVAHVVRTALVGLILALIYLAVGALWPVILIHAAMDLVAGDLGYRALGNAARGDNSAACLPALS